jgi:hypothetical protein
MLTHVEKIRIRLLFLLILIAPSMGAQTWTSTTGIAAGIEPTGTHSPKTSGGAIPFRRAWQHLVYVPSQSKVLWWAGGPNCCSATLQNSLFWLDDTKGIAGIKSGAAWSLAWAGMFKAPQWPSERISACSRANNVVICTLNALPGGGIHQIEDLTPCLNGTSLSPCNGTVTPMTIVVYGATTGTGKTNFAYTGVLCLPPTPGCIIPTKTAPYQFTYQQSGSPDMLEGPTSGTCGSPSPSATCFGGPAQAMNVLTPRHPTTQWAYDNTNDRIWVPGGVAQGTVNGGTGQSPYCGDCDTNDLYYFSKSGSDLDPTQVCGPQAQCNGALPSPRTWGGVVWDDCNNQLILTQGNAAGSVPNDTLEFNPASKTWTRQTKSFSDGGRYRGKAVWNHSQCAVYFFYGLKSGKLVSEEIWKGTATTGNVNWSKLAVNGPAPAPNCDPVIDADPNRGSVGTILYVTQDQPAQVWEFDPAAKDGLYWKDLKILKGPNLGNLAGTNTQGNLGAFNAASSTFDVIINGGSNSVTQAWLLTGLK